VLQLMFHSLLYFSFKFRHAGLVGVHFSIHSCLVGFPFLLVQRLLWPSFRPAFPLSFASPSCGDITVQFNLKSSNRTRSMLHCILSCSNRIFVSPNILWRVSPIRDG
jgi:hypothetical protein